MSSDFSNSFFVIDTNAVIQALNEADKKKQIQEFLKGKKCQIVVCNEVFAELFEPKNPSVGRWPGFTKAIIIKRLQESFGDRILDFSTTGEIKSLAKSLEKKYTAKGLHHPDSILLAIATIQSSSIITGDTDLSNCCKLEKIFCFDQNLTISKPIEIKKKDSSKILSKLDTNFEPKEIEDDVIWLFEDLCDKWEKMSCLDNKQSKFIFATALRRTVSTLKKHDPIFERLLKHKTESLFIDNFFSNIKKGIISYDNLISSLKSKQELKKQNIQDLQSLLDT